MTKYTLSATKHRKMKMGTTTSATSTMGAARNDADTDPFEENTDSSIIDKEICFYAPPALS